MLALDRSDPLVVSLPAAYQGRTLTIAQSTSAAGSDAPGSDADVFPADVTLYCGYAYESELIAQTARHLIPAALLFALGIFILMVFLWNVYYNRLDASLLLLALLAFNMMSRLILQAPFFRNYFGILPVDLTALCLYSSAALLLAFLTCQHTGRLRAAMFVITALQVAIVSFSTISEYQGHIHVQLCANATLSALLLAFLLAIPAWHRGSPFHRHEIVKKTVHP